MTVRGGKLAVRVILSIAAVSVFSCSISVAGVIRIMPVGDSITKGVHGSPVKEWGYRKPLYDKLINADFDFDFVGSQADGNFPDPQHEGHDGWKADDILSHLAAWLNTQQPDVVLLHIGTNDITAGDQDANEVNGILDVIDDYEDANDKHVTVILALIINRMDHNEATTVFNSDVNNMALNRIANGDDIIIVDMEHALNYPDDMYDTRHPNDTGYAKMADVWYNALAARLRGDINGDGFVDWYDLKMMCEDWLSDGKGDINYNGNVDFFDFAVLGFAW